ncbi:uncharacterized protein LOC134856344 [Symsagittifera roscoffensis]|uniref:uncharacterized protein LOC134856344 n=1 Tax=Symsagittifera roscoffensis TaxID=84072 RepID=UPI00307B16EF
MLLDRLFSFPALVAATFLTQLLFKVFVYLFKFWLAEPVNTDQLSSKTFNQVALADLKSENYFVKRNALETLKVYLTKSAQCRKSVYAVSSRTNDSKLWTEILGEVLLNVSYQTEKLKRFRFLVRRQRINNNQQGGPKDKTVAEIKPSRLDFSRNLTSESLEVTANGDVKKSNPNVSMSFFATQVADPFGPWDTMSHHNSSGYNVSKQPRGFRQTAVQDRVIAGMSHFEVLHSWFADSRPVVFLFDKNELAMLATQFEDSAVVSISLEIVRILLDKAIEEDRHGLVLRDLPHVLTAMANLWDAIEQVNALGMPGEPSAGKCCCVAAVRRCLYFLCDMYRPTTNKAIDLSDQTTYLLKEFMLSECRNKLPA